MSDCLWSRSVAVVGAGYWGKNLIRNFDELEALAAVCDNDAAMLATRQESYPDVEMTSDFQSLLDNPKVKQIVIATPAGTHFTLARQAILAGKDVYVEKPLCLDVREGQQLIDLAEEKGAILMVGHLLQYHPHVLKLHELVGSGELGRLQYITSNRLNLGKICTEESSLWSFAPHDVSVILSLCGGHLPEQVRCTGDAYLSKGIADTTLTTLRFPDHVRAHIYVSWLNPFKEQKLTVTGSSAIAVFDDTLSWDNKLVIYRNPVSWSRTTPIPNKPEAEPIAVPQSEPLKNECEHFLTCSLKRRRPRTDGAEGLRVLSVLQAAHASLLDEGEVVTPSQATCMSLLSAEHFAHPTAVVDHEAEIGHGSKIWHFTHVMKGAKLGARCNLGQNVVVSPDVILGENVKVQNNVSIYTGVICEDDVFVGPSVVFTNVTNPRSAIVRKDEFKKTVVRKGASIGANATIICGVKLGAYSFVGAGAVVTKDVKPYALITGNPGKQTGWMSREGHRLDLPVTFDSNETWTATCPASGEVYQLQGGEVSPVSEVELASIP